MWSGNGARVPLPQRLAETAGVLRCPTEMKAEPRAWVEHTVQERRVLWAGDIVEGNRSVSSVYSVHHGDGPTQGSQLLVVHIRKEREGTPGQVVRHRTRCYKHTDGRSRGPQENRREARGWVRRGGDVPEGFKRPRFDKRLIERIELDHESSRAGSLGEATELAVHPECWIANV